MAVAGPAGCADLEELRDHIGDCHRCPLGSTCTRLVFGSGDPHARLMLIGEAPGKNEDLAGEPFVGAAGKLLDELLAGIGLRRSEVFIANMVKCRPPGNRDPELSEIETCAPFLSRQIEFIDPAVIATLGRFASHFVLRTTESITSLRGKVFEVDGRRVAPVFHPAAALYDTSKRSVLEDDFRLLREVIDRDEETITTGDALATHRAGVLLGRAAHPGDVIALSGGLGAGKTALVQGMAEGLGVVGHVPSPTFNILLVHPGDTRLYHFDLYRLERPEELVDIDFYETLESDGVSAIEWADRFPTELPADRLDVVIDVADESRRVLRLKATGPRSRRLARDWADAWRAAGAVAGS